MATQLPSNAGASNTLFNHSRPNDPKSSRFDLSRFTNFTADAGMIIPFDWFVTLPGDRGSINFRMMLDTMPLVVAPMTGYKVTTHWYKGRMSDYWRGWNTFITKGRSGNISKKVPLIDLELPLASGINYEYGDDDQSDVDVLPVSSHSLSSFLGVPPFISGEWDATKEGSNVLPFIKNNYLPFTSKFKGAALDPSVISLIKDLQNTNFNSYRYVNALPFMMYQSIVKNNYVNQNLLEKNTALFPEEGDDHWMLPYNADVVNYVGFEKNSDVPSDRKFSYDGVYSSEDTVVRLDQLRYAQFDDDYFTTSLKWLQRGDAANISLEGTLGGLSIESVLDGAESARVPLLDDRSVSDAEILKSYLGRLYYSSSDPTADPPDQGFTGIPYVSVESIRQRLSVNSAVSGTVNVSTQLTANKLRELIALSVWQERNARVNGSYNSMIYQHWQVNPNQNEHKPVYIGGTVDYINFANVLQNSESGSTPLGTAAGRGSTSGNSFVGNFYSDDYGIVMGIMIIKPDTSYQQGVEHFLSCENVFEDYVQPEFESLSPQPILNKEIYVSGNSSVDNDLFGYQERYTYLKVRQNVNRGLFQCDPRKDSLFAAYTQSRYFNSLPKLSYQFLCMSPNNMRRDWLAYPSMPAFKVQTASEVFVTRRLSYTSEPNTFGF